MKTIDSSFTTADSCSIAYSLHESDSPHRIALIHSLGLDRGIWDSVVRELDGKASVLAYDCRGHGRSSLTPGRYTMDQFARDLAALMDHVGWPSAAIAGCSMGGCVAQAFGGLFPDRATGLGLIDTTAWYGADAPTVWRQRAATAKTNGLAGMVEFQLARWFGDGFRATRPDLVDASKQVFLAGNVDCYGSACELLGDADLRPWHSALTMPVAVIVGEEDYATPLAAAEYMHQSIPGSTLTILKGRHLTPIECPEQVTAVLQTLFRSPKA
jgi:3-oxoadipate enol-lactonase